MSNRRKHRPSRSRLQRRKLREFRLASDTGAQAHWWMPVGRSCRRVTVRATILVILVYVGLLMSADLLGPGDDRYGFTGRDPQNNPIDVHLLSAEPGELWGGGNVRLDARITNHGAAPIRNLMIKADWASPDNVPEPRVLDQPKYVDLAPGTSVEYVGRIKVSQGASYSLGVVAIAPDSTASWSLKSVQVVDIGFVVMAMALVSKSVVVLMGSFDPRGLVWLVVFPALAALLLIPVSYLVLTVSRAVDGISPSPKFPTRTLVVCMH